MLKSRLEDPTLSRRFIGRIIITGGLLVLSLLAIAGVSLWNSYTQDRISANNTIETSALLLEQALTRSFESTDVALTTLSRRATSALSDPDQVESDRETLQAALSDANFRDSVSGLMRFAPHIRQLLIADENGYVLFDTANRRRGRLTLAKLGIDQHSPHAISGGLLLGTPINGRFLALPEGTQTPPGMTVLPVVLPFYSEQMGQLYAIAALNSGFFREVLDAVVASDRAGTADHAMIARYDGTVLIDQLTATQSPPQSQLTSRAGSIPLLTTALVDAMNDRDGGALALITPYAVLSPDIEWNSYNPQTIHWRVSSRYPVAVFVSIYDSTLISRWLQGQRDILIGLPLALLALIVLIWGLIRQVVARSILKDRVRVLSQAIEQGPTTVIITDSNGRIEYVNKVFEKTMGFALPEIQGETPAVIKSGRMRDSVYSALWETITAGGVWQGELLNQTKDGDLRWMSAAISGVRSEQGDISHFVAVESDITEQRLLDERLAETQRMAEGLLQLPIIMYRINAQGIILDAVGEGLSTVGLQASSLIGRRCHSIFPNLKGAFHRAVEGEMVRSEGMSRFGHRAVWLDHLLAPNHNDTNESTSILLPEHEETVGGGVIGIALDVTARHEAEASLSATIDRLNASNRELEQFAYVASHDLQEPLRIVSSYLSLLKRRYAGKLGDDADTFIEYAVDGAHRMQSLILDLLQLSRIDTQGQEMETVNLNLVVKQALANLDMAINEADATVRVGQLPHVKGDKVQLLRLFQNLINNAIKYRHPNRLPEVTIDACLEGGMWHILVQDNGEGIEPPFREKIFMIFQRLHTRENSHGNGIGLAICRKIVERHGGKIWIDGDHNIGSQFHVTLQKEDKQDPLNTVDPY